jgi:hypothetical protein
MATVGGRVLRVSRVHAIAGETFRSGVATLSVTIGGGCAGAAELLALAGAASTLVRGRAAAGVASAKPVLVLYVFVSNEFSELQRDRIAYLVVSTGGASTNRARS